MEPVLALLLVLMVFLLLRGRAGKPSCPVCGLPRLLAEEVARGRRHCPRLGWGRCPFDPRRGVWRQRR
jgi:hypothetical protein